MLLPWDTLKFENLFQGGVKVGQDGLPVEILPDGDLPAVSGLLHPAIIEIDGGGNLEGFGPGRILYDSYCCHIEK